MPNYVFKVQKKGFSEVNKLLSDARERMRDLTIPLRKAGLVMLRSIDMNFKSGGLPQPWRRLRPATVRFKARNGYSPLPLTRSGALRRSVTFNVRGNKLAIGTSIPYGAVHQFGGGNNIPKRPYLLFKNDDVDKIERLVVSHITGRNIT